MATLPCSNILKRLNYLHLQMYNKELSNSSLNTIVSLEKEKHPDLSDNQIWWNIIYSFIKQTNDQTLDFYCHQYFNWNEDIHKNLAFSPRQHAA